MTDGKRSLNEVMALLGEVLPEDLLHRLDVAACRTPERMPAPQLKVVGG
ncbi:hypothetical protein [Thermomonas sp. HDW16]|nr:hypothetical protein [Thermomonas sp. HDW16]QIL21552.1 hypothetical protein G7079_12855 [Thermomonas sp. HDW16]